MRVIIHADDVAKLKTHWADRDPAEAVAALHRQGLAPKDIAEIIDKSLRQTYRLIKESGGLSKAELRAQREGLPDLGAMEELSEEDRELILSHTPAGLLRFAELYSHLIPGDIAGPLPQHTWPWIDAYFETDLLQLNVPPAHWKSAVFSVLVPLYEIICNRAIRIILVSQSADLAIQWTRNIASVLKSDPIVRAFGRFAPDVKGQAMWSEGTGSLRIQEGSEFTILSRGSQSAIFGRRADLIITDDPSNTDTARSATETDRLFGRWQMEALTRGSASAKVVVIGQRLGSNDFFQRVQDLEDDFGNPLFRTIKTPAVLRWPDKDVNDNWIAETAEVLFPTSWPWPELLKKYNQLGESKFSTLYQQVPRSLEGGLMSSETFQKALEPNLKAWQGRRSIAAKAVEAEGVGRQNPYVRVISVDPSPTQFYGLVVADVCVLADGNVDTWVLACTRFKARAEGSAEHFLRTVAAYAQKYHVSHVVIEESSFFKYAKETPWWKVIFERPGAPQYVKQLTGDNKHHNLYGVESLAADFELGRMHLPWGDEAGQQMTSLLQEEIEQYEQGGRVTSDIIMALWFLKVQAKRLKPKKKWSGQIPGSAQGPNASGRAIRAARYQNQRQPVSLEEFRRQGQKEAVAAKRADQLVAAFAARHEADMEEEEAYA